MSEKLYVTKNGIKIYSYKNESAHSFFVSMFLRAGSMFEREEDGGITHFLEHISLGHPPVVLYSAYHPHLKHGHILLMFS